MCSLTTDLPPKTNVLYTVSLNGNGLSSTTSHSAEPKEKERTLLQYEVFFRTFVLT